MRIPAASVCSQHARLPRPHHGRHRRNWLRRSWATSELLARRVRLGGMRLFGHRRPGAPPTFRPPQVAEARSPAGRCPAAALPGRARPRRPKSLVRRVLRNGSPCGTRSASSGRARRSVRAGSPMSLSRALQELVQNGACHRAAPRCRNSQSSYRVRYVRIRKASHITQRTPCATNSMAPVALHLRTN